MLSEPADCTALYVVPGVARKMQQSTLSPPDAATAQADSDLLERSLLPFQRDGVRFGTLACEGKCLIADEMGLGKTIQAIAIANRYRNEWPALVVCPSSMKYAW